MSGLGERWVEPFCGGLGAFVEIAPSYQRALVSDFSPVAAMWAAAKAGWEPEVAPLTREQLAAAVAVARSSDPTPQSVYLAHTGSVRGSPKKGWSKTDRVASGLRRFRKVSKMLVEMDAEIRQCDYKEVVRECGRGDVLYLDPPYASRGDWLDKASTFNLDEMMIEAEAAVARGAVTFISHYDELPIDRWVKVDSRVDLSPVPGKESVKIYEYLYVDINSYRRYDWRSVNDKGHSYKYNRTSEQAAVRRQVKAMLEVNGLFRCEATGVLFNDVAMDLAHHPGHEWSVTGRTVLNRSSLVNCTFHRYMDAGMVSIVGGVWRVDESIRNVPGVANAHGRRIDQFRRLTVITNENFVDDVRRSGNS